MPATADRVDPVTWKVAGTVVVGGIMTNVDTTAVNVALHSLSRDFGASVTQTQWVVTAYLLALATVIPLSGWATDRFGGRRVWVASIAMFVAGSMLAGAAWSLGSLVCFRVLQGFGGGMIMPVGMTLLTRAAGPAHVGRAMGALGVQQLLGPVLGPVIGGLLVEHAGWRGIFYINVPISVLAIAAAMRFLPRARPQPCDKLDLRGFLLLSPGIAALVYGLTELSHDDGAAAARTLGPVLLGAALMTAFVFHARRARNALIDVRLFRRRDFSAGVATSFCISMALFGVLFLLPLYYQRARGLSPVDAGLLLAPQGIGAAITMPIAGRLTDRIGPGRVVLSGLALVLAATLPFAVAGVSAPYPLLALALVARGMGLGASTMPAMAGAYASLDSDAVARAASILNVVKRVGGSVGVAWLAVVIDRRVPALDSRGMSASDAVAGAFASSFWWVSGFCALALVSAAFLPRRPVTAAEPSATAHDRTRRSRNTAAVLAARDCGRTVG